MENCMQSKHCLHEICFSEVRQSCAAVNILLLLVILALRIRILSRKQMEESLKIFKQGRQGEHCKLALSTLSTLKEITIQGTLALANPAHSCECGKHHLPAAAPRGDLLAQQYKPK